jgi:hypothetical protein
MYSLMLLTVLAQPAPEAAAAGGVPPQQVLASIDARGNLTITQVSCHCPGEFMGTFVVPAPVAPEGEKAPAKAKSKVKVTNLMVTMTEMPAKDVQAFTVDGREVSAEKLATLLAKERTVLVALDGKKVDPFHLKLYKEDTLVLVPPPNTVGAGGMFSPWGGYGAGAVMAPVQIPAPSVAFPATPLAPFPPAALPGEKLPKRDVPAKKEEAIRR